MRPSIDLPLIVLALFAAVAVVPNTSQARRILGIFTHIGGSHYHTFYPIMNGLAERGHDVTVLSFFAAKNPLPNYHELRFDGVPVINSSLALDRNADRSLRTMYSEFFNLWELGDLMCRQTFASPHFDAVLREHRRQPFDLVLTEFFDSDCVLGFVHLLQVPYVGISSCVLMPWLHDRVSMPDLPSFVPNEFVGMSERMSYAERFTSWLMVKSLKLMYRLVELNDNRLVAERFGPGIPDVAELARNVSLVLVNTHYSLHGPRPTSPQLVEIGGVHIKAAKPLPVVLQTLLDSAASGVIVISWGSNLNSSSLDVDKVQSILRAVAQMPQQIVWKWENENLPNKPDNVHIQKWLPQRDILCHPNVRLFWSHAGNLGMSESVHCGTPLITTPIYGDQFVNEAAAINRGMAVRLPFDDIARTELVLAALHEALLPVYKQNAVRTSQAFRERPLSPLDTALWWIEHVISTGGFVLGRSYAVEMSWFTYHSVDVLLPVLILLAILLWGLAVLVVRCCGRKKVAGGGSSATKLKRK